MLYARLEPFQSRIDPNHDGREITDEELGWPLLIFNGCIAKRWQEIEDLIRDTDTAPGWSALVDVDRIPDKGLPYLAQFKGKTILPGMTPDQIRDRIKTADGQDRGTAGAVSAAAKRRLAQRLRINLTPNPKAGSGALTNWTNTGLLSFDPVTLGQAGAPAPSAEMAGLGLTTAFHAVANTVNDRAYVAIPVVNGRTYRFSMYVYLVSSSGAGMDINIRKADGVTIMADSVNQTATGAWVRLDVSVVATETATWRFSPRSLAAAADWYFTGVLIEESAALNPYFDGDMKNARFSAADEVSTSYLYDEPGSLADPVVLINERQGDDVWSLGVVTRDDQTPDPTGTFNDITEQKPYGVILTHTVSDAWGYQVLKLAFDDYGEVKTQYPNYTGLKTNVPPAPGT